MTYTDGDAGSCATNPRNLCAGQSTLSQTCRKVRINRRQLNKCLSGVHATVQRNSIRFLFSVASGTATTMFRRPFATKWRRTSAETA